MDDALKKTGDAARLGWNSGVTVVAAFVLGSAFIFFGISPH